MRNIVYSETHVPPLCGNECVRNTVYSETHVPPLCGNGCVRNIVYSETHVPILCGNDWSIRHVNCEHSCKCQCVIFYIPRLNLTPVSRL